MLTRILLGSYTFAKTLEYKAKQGLNSGSGKEVTVVPPNEYQERFVNAMDDYFLACPSTYSIPSYHRVLAPCLHSMQVNGRVRWTTLQSRVTIGIYQAFCKSFSRCSSRLG